MNRFLDDFVTTLSSQRQERVGHLLAESRLAKEQLDTLATRIQDFQNFAPFVAAQAAQGTVVSSADFQANFQDMFQRTKEMYDMSNLVSLLLDSHAAVLSSDVQALEDHLNVLEKMTSNYAFLLADGGAYNYAFLEPFSDERGREDSFDFNIPDRASQLFGPAENAIIRPAEGVLALTDQPQSPHATSAQIIKGNATAFVTSDTGVQNCVNDSSTAGWRMTVSAASPITSSLPEAGDATGAQVIVEFVLSQPAPANQIKITPFADMAMQVLQLQLFPGDDDSVFTNVLQAPMQLDRNITVHFPMQSVARFRLVLNQPTYNKIASVAPATQTNYLEILREVIIRRRKPRRRVNFLFILKTQEILKVVFRRRRKVIVSLPQIDFDVRWGPLRVDRLIEIDRLRPRRGDEWFIHDRLSGTVIDIYKNNLRVNTRIFNRNIDRFEDRYDEIDITNRAIKIHEQFNLTVQSTGSFSSTQSVQFTENISEVIYRRSFIRPRRIKAITILTAIPYTIQTPPTITGFSYRYNLGLQSVSIGANQLGFKGVFVSKTMPAPGDIGEVRVKVSDFNFRDPTTTRDSSLFTSTEYSVSNQSEPRNESDWIPILPIDRDTLIEGERFFPDSSGRGFLRFPASLQKSVVLYKNGFQVKELDPVETYIYGTTKQNFVGLSLPKGSFTSEDVFTVDYWPADDYTTVNFASAGFQNVPLIAMHDDTGAGEGFTDTGGRNTVDLSYFPYIDPEQVKSSTYSTTYGLTPYQPVTVQLEDGTEPINLTNYQGGDQATLPTDGLYYIHSGTSLMFSHDIDQPFRVYYQYLENNVRVRVVLRVNDKAFVSPTVDYYHLKAKTRRPDASKEL